MSALEREVISKAVCLLQLINPDINDDALTKFVKSLNVSEPVEPVQWIKTSQAMKILDCSATSIYNLCRAQAIQHRYLGGGVTGSRGKLRILLSDCYKAEPVKRKQVKL